VTNPSIPRDLAVVVATAMERERARRYRSALALAEDLEACVAGRRSRAADPAPGRALRAGSGASRGSPRRSRRDRDRDRGPRVDLDRAGGRGRPVAAKNAELVDDEREPGGGEGLAETNERIAAQRPTTCFSLSRSRS
jgi:hypothetical protein